MNARTTTIAIIVGMLLLSVFGGAAVGQVDGAGVKPVVVVTR